VVKYGRRQQRSASGRPGSLAPVPRDSSAPSLRAVVAVLDDLYDPRLAESWDAVGLVTGDLDQPVRRVLLAVDPVDEVITEALDWGADLLLVHHPLLLRGVHTVATAHPKGRAVTRLVRAGLALHVAHTNADSASPGVSDALAGALGLIDLTPLVPKPDGSLDKLVVFVPVESADPLVDALAAAGAGRLGDYSRAAWSTTGTGTFRPLAGASPTIGAVGEIEQVPEARVEMVLPPHRRTAVLAALRATHPYEEPAYDVFPTVAPDGPHGLGRVGALPAPEPLRDFAERVSAALPHTASGVRVAGDLDAPVQRVAVCGGAGDDLFDVVRRHGADVYVTADLRHHPASESLAHGRPALVDCAHWASEWPWLVDAERLLRGALAAQGTTVDTRVSHLVTDPWSLRLPGALPTDASTSGEPR
jgi:dinuclear metal center YbgI/SA1388 family protein